MFNDTIKKRRILKSERDRDQSREDLAYVDMVFNIIYIMRTESGFVNKG